MIEKMFMDNTGYRLHIKTKNKKYYLYQHSTQGTLNIYIRQPRIRFV